MQKQLSIILLLIGITLTSCVREDLEKPCPLVLNLNSTWSPDAEIIPVKSGTTLLPLPEGTTLGVRVQDLSQTAASSYISYTAAADGSVAPSTANALTVNPNHNYDLYLYSPFRNDATTQGTFFHGEDVMWVEALRNFKGGVAINRTLAHKMSQVDMIIAYAPTVSAEIQANYPLANATIEVTGFYTNCTMDLETGLITARGLPNAIITQLGESVCFVPFPAPGNVDLQMTLTLPGLDGTTKVFTAHLTDLIPSGVSMKFTLTLDENSIITNEITLTSEVQPWVTGSSTTDVGLN